MNHNRSVATIDAPEFINLEPNAINPGISECEIKVFYLGQNRNHSYIDKNTAIQMANSLPGTPIVGAFIDKKDDFGDHGDILHIEDGEITFSCKTVPYGFVAPNADVWFQKFIDTDEFGNNIEREYLMTQGYLWTAQYEEAMKCIKEGKGQSMELDGQTMDGHWATDNNTGIEFFIINDAIFTKLCILGDDVEPCFEGASVTDLKVSKNFSKDPEFSHTLFSMMNELKFTLQNEGGSDMPETIEQIEQEEIEATESTEVEEVEESADSVEENEGEDSDDSEDEEFACGTKKKKKYTDEDEEEFACGTKKKKYAEEENDEFACGTGTKKKKYADNDEEKEEETAEESGQAKDNEDDKSKKKPAAQHSLEEFETLQNQMAQMQEELNSLRAFKLEQENEAKDALINKYFMLSDEEKADVIAHKSEYSLNQIEEKLALVYVKKNVNFDAIDGSYDNSDANEDEDPSLTFSLEDSGQSVGFVPPLVEVLREVKQSR